MKRITLLELDLVAKTNPNAWHDAIAAGQIVDGTAVELPDDYPLNVSRPPGTMAKSVCEWPIWARTISAKRAGDDKGVGDTAERLFGRFGGAAFKIAMSAAGLNCGCAARKDSWNALYPYFT